MGAPTGLGSRGFPVAPDREPELSGFWRFRLGALRRFRVSSELGWLLHPWEAKSRRGRLLDTRSVRLERRTRDKHMQQLRHRLRRLFDRWQARSHPQATLSSNPSHGAPKQRGGFDEVLRIT